MKKWMLALAVMTLFLSVGVGAAETYKFGYVDFQRALNEVEEGKKAKSMLKGEFEEKQKQLDVIQNQLQAMKADLDKQRLILSSDALKEKEEEYRKKFLELQQKLNIYKDDLASKEAKLTSDILNILKQMIKNIGEKEEYTLILEKSQDVVLFSQTDGDLTERLIKEYNSLSKDKKQAILTNKKDK